MPASTGVLKGRLSRNSEINITVTGRTSRRAITIPIWFVFDDDTLYLLPVRGSDTRWYKNVLAHPSIRISAGGEAADLSVVPLTGPAQVSSVVEKFRGKYGDSGVKLYSKLDVAVLAQLP